VVREEFEFDCGNKIYVEAPNKDSKSHESRGG
jgi:hypothetical protein